MVLSAGATGNCVDTIQLEYSQYRVGEAFGLVGLAVLRGPDAAEAATVEFTTRGQTATPDADYTESSGRLGFAPGERLKLISIPIVNDVIKEWAETFQVQLSNVTGSGLGSRVSATVTIVDNDQGVQFSTREVWGHEDQGRVELKVRRGSDSREPMTVDYIMNDITAKSGEDYSSAHGTLRFAADENDQSIWISVTDDRQLEADERFRVQLTNPSPGATLGSPASVTVTLVDSTGMERSRFAGAERLSDGSVEWAVAGPTSPRFREYWRVFQLEVSDDLQQWTPLPLIGTRTHSRPLGVNLGLNDEQERLFARLIQSPQFSPDPPPTGPHAVGVTRRDIVDPTRRNRYGVSILGGFPVTIWYPAIAVAGRLPDLIIEEALLTVEAAGPPGLMDRLPRFGSYSTRDLPLAHPSGSGWPVVLFSHGADAFRAQGQAICQNLASHGMVVISPDHYDAFAVLLASGQVYLSQTTASFTAANSLDRVKDLVVALDTAEHLDEHDLLLRSALDLSRIGAIGFSWGALTAAECCRTDSRCKTVVSLDWGNATTAAFPDLVREGVPHPSLMINAADNPSAYLFDKANHDAVWIQISNTTHGDLVLAPWINGGITTESLEVARTVQAYVVSFFRRYLFNQDDHLLDGPSPAYPRVTTFREK